MEAVQKDHWYFVVLLFLPFLKVAVQQKESVTVRLEEGMVLGCLCPWPGNLTLVSWTKIPKKNPLAVFHPEFGVAPSHHYQERIEFLRNSPMDGSISLRNVTHQDIGLYQCSIQTFPQGSWTTIVQVEDLDEPPAEDNSTQPPVTDVITADMTLAAEENGNVTISCKNEHNGTVHQVSLEKKPHGQNWSAIGECKKVKHDLHVHKLLCTDTLDVSLQLTSVGQQDGGFYRCTFSTDAGLQTTTVLLTVTPSGGFSLPLYTMYIYIAAGAACLVLLTVIVIVTVRCRNNRKLEYRVKLHQSQRPPNIYENVSVCPQKKTRHIKKSPDYVNLETARSYKNQTAQSQMSQK